MNESNTSLEKVCKHSAATLHEAMGKYGALPAAIKPISPDMKLCGTAFTIDTMPGDNLLLHKAIASAATGDVLVAARGNGSDPSARGSSGSAGMSSAMCPH